MHSKLALKLYAMIKLGIIKSNAMFWRDFFDETLINSFELDLNIFEKELQDKKINLICVFDDGFPKINIKIKPSERPFFFAYKGNIDLLKNTTNNVAVVGVLTPTKDIISREEKIVEWLVKNDLTIVSGLAKGCDTIAHLNAIKNNGKTIAILPTSFENIYPNENKNLVEDIVNKDGLVITEYVSEPKNKYERISRFISRDRLQAMFSKAVILIASFTKGNGDSGSRHALQKAKEYGKNRYIMFDENTDQNIPIFELNKQQLSDNAIALTDKSIKELMKLIHNYVN